MSDTGTPAPGRPNIQPWHIHALGAVGMLALAGVVYAFGVAPSLRAQEQALAQQDAIARAGERVRAVKGELATARARLETLRESAGPEPIPGEQLVGHVSEVITRFGLSPLGVDRSGAEPVGDLLSTRITLNAAGSFSDIDAFLTGLGDSIPGATVEGFAIVPAPLEGQGLTLIATVLVYAPQPSAPASPAASADGSDGSSGTPAR